MRDREIDKNSLDLLYITGCSIRGLAPDWNRLVCIDWEQLWERAGKQKMRAIIGVWLEGLSEAEKQCVPEQIRQNFQEHRINNFRRRVLFDLERNALFQWMEEQNIWYLPLKGIVIQDLYPAFEMREMSDNDILFNPEKRKEVRDYFVNRGYSFSLEHNVEAFYKEPVFNFEMHRSLFGTNTIPEFEQFFEDLPKRMIRVDESRSEYRMSEEDFYIYFLTHVFKHYNSAGCGLRFLVDGYLIYQAKSASFDMSYLQNAMKKTKLVEFEMAIRGAWTRFCQDPSLFRIDDLSDAEYMILKNTVNEPVYGSSASFARNFFFRETGTDLNKKDLGKYVMKRLFPSWSYMKASYPIVAKVPALLAAMYLVRPLHRLFSRGKEAVREIETIRHLEER